jgi:hypothetical protein
MNYFVSEEVPAAWDPIIKAFVKSVFHDVEFNNGVFIEETEFRVRHGLLYITYSGGNKTTDAFASFAKQMSINICSECGLPSTRLIFESPKCDNCY